MRVVLAIAASIAASLMMHPAQSRVEVRCHPVIVPDRDCSLGSHFKNGGLPQECDES